LGGWEFWVKQGGVNVAGPLTTDASGALNLPDLPGGVYELCETLKPGWVNSDPGGGNLCKTLFLPGPSSATIVIPDNKNSTMRVDFVSKTVNSAGRSTWTYRMSEVSGNNLAYWQLGINSCISHIVSFSPTGGYSTHPNGQGSLEGFAGVKWSVNGGFTTGLFSITLDQDYAASSIQTLAKTQSAYGIGNINGPDCTRPASQQPQTLLFGNYANTIQPIMECVDNDGSGNLTAHFGYDNSLGAAVANSSVVTVNGASVGAVGQPTNNFLSGVNSDVFTVAFDGKNGGTTTWTVVDSNGVSMSATAELFSTPCDDWQGNDYGFIDYLIDNNIVTIGGVPLSEKFAETSAANRLSSILPMSNARVV
jgi:hypothetical protein